jgi:hypothetical protein
VRRRLLVEEVDHIELEPTRCVRTCAARATEQIRARQERVRPMSPRPSTRTGIVFSVFTTVLMGVPLPA